MLQEAYSVKSCLETVCPAGNPESSLPQISPEALSKFARMMEFASWWKTIAFWERLNWWTLIRTRTLKLLSTGTRKVSVLLLRLQTNPGSCLSIGGPICLTVPKSQNMQLFAVPRCLDLSSKDVDHIYKKREQCEEVHNRRTRLKGLLEYVSLRPSDLMSN
jgi:hypothetical protein